MFTKSYGLVYIKGRWYVKNYHRVLKKGGLSFLPAKYLAWNRNRKGEGKIIDLKRIVPRPGPAEDYQPDAFDGIPVSRAKIIEPGPVEDYNPDQVVQEAMRQHSEAMQDETERVIFSGRR